MNRRGILQGIFASLAAIIFSPRPASSKTVRPRAVGIYPDYDTTDPYWHKTLTIYPDGYEDVSVKPRFKLSPPRACTIRYKAIPDDSEEIIAGVSLGFWRTLSDEERCGLVHDWESKKSATATLARIRDERDKAQTLWETVYCKDHMGSAWVTEAEVMDTMKSAEEKL